MIGPLMPLLMMTKQKVTFDWGYGHTSFFAPPPRSVPTDLAGQKELEEYEKFLKEYSEQLNGIEEALDDTLGDLWDFSLDPIGLQVKLYKNIHYNYSFLFYF